MTTRQRNATREHVYAVIDGERDYQIDGQGNSRRDPNDAPNLSVGESIGCIDKLMLDAKLAWYKPGGNTEALAHLRKVAAVAVQAMENYGAPAREGYEPIL
jgi:hypothetical protein